MPWILMTGNVQRNKDQELSEHPLPCPVAQKDILLIGGVSDEETIGDGSP